MYILLNNQTFMISTEHIDRPENNIAILVHGMSEDPGIFYFYFSEFLDQYGLIDVDEYDTDATPEQAAIDNVIEYVILQLGRAYRIQIGSQNGKPVFMTPATPGFLKLIEDALNDNELYIDASDADIQAYLKQRQ